MRRLGVVCALRSERRAWLRGCARPCAFETVVHTSGVGADAAAAAARSLLDANVDALLSFGVCGGLNPKLVAGDLVATSSVGRAEELFSCRAPAFLDAGFPTAAATLTSACRLLATPEAKADLFDATGADVVDMESAAIARVCLESEIPFLAVRAVIDEADQALPLASFDVIDENGALRPLRLTAVLVRHPGLLADLVPLGRAERLALASLERAARALTDARG